MRSPGAIRSGAAISGLALLAGLSLLLAVGTADAPGFGLLALGSLVGLVTVVTPAASTRSLRAPRGRARGGADRPSRDGVAAAGAAMVCGLLLAVAAEGAAVVGLAIMLAGLLGCAVLVTPRVASASRRVVWPLLGIVLVGLAIVALIRFGAGIRLPTGIRLDTGWLTGSHVWQLSVWRLSLWQLAVVFGAAAGGLLLLADALAAGQRREDTDRSGWNLITRTGRRRSTTVWRSFVGGLMVLWATGFAIALAASQFAGHPVLVIVSAIGVTIAAVVVIGTPLLVMTSVSRQRLVADRTREAERRRIAAHLHDSVLQTLALVQRQAADPDAVSRLAHRQELSLRNWMAGESEPAPGSLAAALQATIVEVEDAAEVSIELSMVGDRPTEPRDEALVAATREALRNAARHARGSPVRVYAEVMDELVEVYVSDDGPGFVPGEIPDTRRGIRDAIIARMQAVGGSAEILAEPGHGTEVMLRLPAA